MSATVIVTSPTSSEVEGDQRVVFADIGWKGYCALLRIKGDRCVPKAVYLDGSVYLVSPALPHEHWKARLGYLVLALVKELDIPCRPTESTTFRRKGKRGGVEGDKTFYLANEARVRGKDKIDLRVDPPPDLAIEVAWTHPADEAIEVYRRLRVPEVWVCGPGKLEIRVLQPEGRYALSPRSQVLPAISAVEILDWVTRPQTESETAWMKSLCRWVAETLVPRHREANRTDRP